MLNLFIVQLWLGRFLAYIMRIINLEGKLSHLRISLVAPQIIIVIVWMHLCIENWSLVARAVCYLDIVIHAVGIHGWRRWYKVTCTHVTLMIFDTMFIVKSFIHYNHACCPSLIFELCLRTCILVWRHIPWIKRTAILSILRSMPHCGWGFKIPLLILCAHF